MQLPTVWLLVLHFRTDGLGNGMSTKIGLTSCKMIIRQYGQSLIGQE